MFEFDYFSIQALASNNFNPALDMNFKQVFFLLIATVFLQSCIEEKKLAFDPMANERMLRSKGTYSAYLALEYLQFSRNLSEGKNKKDARYFLEKSSDVGAGKEVVPENPVDWGADPAQIEELVAMQKRLEIISNPQIQNRLPIQMAHLTYLYDCWAAKESKPIFRSSEIAKCRGRFYKLLEEIEYYTDELKQDHEPLVEIIEPKFERFEVAFDLNGYKLDDRAVKKFLEVINYLTTMNGDYRLLLVGNADRSGSVLLNQNLALKRVEVVKNYLIKNGVTEDLMEVRTFGEDFPDIITKKGMQLQSNRTVGIYVLKGAKSFDKIPLPMIENIIYAEGIKKTRQKRGLR